MGVFLEGFFRRIFLGRTFGEDFWGGFFGGLFLEEFFGRNSLFYFNVEGIDLFVKILVLVKILSESRKRK